MKLSDYAKKLGISYKSAWRLYKQGHIKGYQLPTGTIIVEEDKQPFTGNRCIIVGNHNNIEKLKEYATSKGYQVVDVLKEMDFTRDDYDILVVWHKNKIVDCSKYIEQLLKKSGKRIEIVKDG